jgi:ribonuclease D
LITTKSELEIFVNSIKNQTKIAIDTEFKYTNTYYPQLCLIQIATKNNIDCIDVLALDNLDILFAKLYQKNCLWILHSAQQDISAIYHLSKQLPKLIFDTQIAANLLNYDFQISYQKLIEILQKIKLDKAYTRFDWKIRPLPKEAIEYALSDVRYLLNSYYKLLAQLQKENKTTWMEEEIKILLNAELYSMPIEKAWKKLKGFSKINNKDKLLAAKLASLREYYARSKNKPRQWIIKDADIIKYFNEDKKYQNQNKFIKKLDSFIANNQEIQNIKFSTNNNKPLTKTEKIKKNVLQKLIKEKANKYNLPVNVISNNKSITKYIRGDRLVNFCQGWRYNILKKELKMQNSTNITAGNIPDEINVIIEIPSNSLPVKYEVDKKTNALFVDRFIPTSMFYPCNYGFVPETLANDGDPADLLVITPYPLIHNSVIKVRPIGVLKMTDEAGEDAKILSVPTKKICPAYANINDIDDVDTILKDKIEHFFKYYKALEKDKWVKIEGWQNASEAKKELIESYENYKK